MCNHLLSLAKRGGRVVASRHLLPYRLDPRCRCGVCLGRDVLREHRTVSQPILGTAVHHRFGDQSPDHRTGWGGGCPWAGPVAGGGEATFRGHLEAAPHPVCLPRGDARGCPQSQVSENGLCTNSDSHAQGASLAAGGATLTRPGHGTDPYASPQAVGALACTATYPSGVVTGTFQNGPL